MKIYINIIRILPFIMLIHFNIAIHAQRSGEFIDQRDGSTYNWIEISGQTWMTDNMRWYPNDKNYQQSILCPQNSCDQEKINQYGLLYTYEIADQVCPMGWHLPSQSEFETLFISIAKDKNAQYSDKSDAKKGIAKLLKQGQWTGSSSLALNTYGFSARAVGVYMANKRIYSEQGRNTGYWAMNEHYNVVNGKFYNESSGYFLDAQSNDIAYHENLTFENGLSIRCVKDGSEISAEAISKHRKFDNYKPDKFEGEIFSIVNNMPKFPGNEYSGLKNYIDRNLIYPQEAKNAGIEGRVFVSIVIDEEGFIRNVELTRSAHQLLDDEALMLVMSMPRWLPGSMDNTKKLAVLKIIPVVFKL